MAVQREYVGFYWTYPVAWAGFTKLPLGGIDEAAAKSKTIRYQRELIRSWVEETGGSLIDEVVLIEKTDRPGSELSQRFKTKLRPMKKRCIEGEAILLFVRFDKRLYWRPQTFFLEYLKSEGFRYIDLNPTQLPPERSFMVDGVPFDIVTHFKTSRKTSKDAVSRRRDIAQPALQSAALTSPPQRGRHGLIAKRLNEENVKTVNGRKWTAESVRAQLKRWKIK